MKKLFLLVIFTKHVLAGEGIIKALEAPILAEPDLSSQVVQTVRKGDEIFIHEKHFFGSPIMPNYDDERSVLASLEEDDDRFYETKTRNGLRGYIPRHLVKLIHKDIREFDQKIGFDGHDPTDYRLTEPLQEGYPLIDNRKRRAWAGLAYGPDFKTSYPYRQAITRENFSNRIGANTAYLFKVDWDRYDRFYVGPYFHIFTSQARFETVDGLKAEDTRGMVGAGPILTYDIWRNDDYRLTTGAGLIVDFKRFIVSHEDTAGNFEERSFKGWSLSPKLTAIFQWRNVAPGLDFITGIDGQIILPHTLESSSPITNRELWISEDNSLDRIDIPFSGILSIFIGVQTVY